MTETTAANAFLAANWIGIVIGAILMWSFLVFSRRATTPGGTTTSSAPAHSGSLRLTGQFLAAIGLATILAILEDLRGVHSVTEAVLTGALLMLLPVGFHIGRATKSGSMRTDSAHLALSALGGVICAIAIYFLRS